MLQEQMNEFEILRKKVACYHPDGDHSYTVPGGGSDTTAAILMLSGEIRRATGVLEEIRDGIKKKNYIPDYP